MGPAIAPKRKVSQAGLQADQLADRGRAPYPTSPGRPHPLGATVHAGGVNFAVFSQHATGIELLLFDEHDDPEPVQRIALDPERTRPSTSGTSTSRGCEPGMHYAYRVDGPDDPAATGTGSIRNKVLIDPYAKGITNNLWDRGAACGPDDNLAHVDAQRGLDTDGLRLGGRPAAQPADERDDRLRDARRRLHAVTRRPGVQHPGTFAGVDREDSVPQGARRHGGRAAAGLRVRRDRSDPHRARTASRCSTSGATAPSASSRRTAATASSPDEGTHITRVPRHGEGAAQGGHRGHPRRRVQPHRRGERPGPDHQLQGASTTASTTTSSRTTGSTTWTTPAAATRSTATTRSSRS